MGWGHRVFVIDSADEISRFSYSRYRRLWDGDESAAVPEMRNSKVRFATVIVETINRRPKKVLGIDCTTLEFDKFGRLDQKFKQRMMDEAMKRVGLNRTKMEPPYFCWTPTDDIELSIRTATFGNKKG